MAYRIGYLLGKTEGFTDYQGFYDKYEALEKISFDYAVIEKETDIWAMRFSGDWKDLGTYRVLDVSDGSMTIRVTLDAGSHMNYHSHERRDEVWTVISGSGVAIVDGVRREIQVGDVVSMPAGCRHTVTAVTRLEMIEVQLGKDISVHDKVKHELLAIEERG